MRRSRSLAVFGSLASFVCAVSVLSGQQQPRTPVFRAGAHLVTVDAYPTSAGQVIKDLTPDDFEVFEDGKPQKVENLEFFDYDTPLPDDDRNVLLSARDGLELAGKS